MENTGMAIGNTTPRIAWNLMRTATVLLAAASAALWLQAQSYYGGLRGIVVDQNGGAIGNAKVTLTDQGTGGQRSTLTSTGGEYLFSELVPATYSVTVESAGFKKFERK